MHNLALGNGSNFGGRMRNLEHVSAGSANRAISIDPNRLQPKLRSTGFDMAVRTPVSATTVNVVF
jgi:hypothetical protein